MDTSLILTSRDSTGNKIQKSFTNVSASVADADLLSFAKQFNALSTHTYVQTDRVNKINLDDAETEANNNG